MRRRPGTAGCHGKSDSTTVHLQFANSVNRQLAFLLPDGLLESLSNATPDTLPPGQADTLTPPAVDAHRTGGRPRLRLAPRGLGLPLAGVLLLQDAPRDHPGQRG